MKPTRNRIFCPECRRTKMLFESEDKAERFIKFNKSEMEGHHPVRAYYCIACGGWHTTSHEDYRPGVMDSENIIDAYRQDVENKLEHEISILVERRRIPDIHNFLQRCVNGKKPLRPTHEQLLRIKAAYLAADRYPHDGKCRKRVRQMLTQLGVGVTDKELNASDKEAPADEDHSCGSCSFFTNEDIYGDGICDKTGQPTFCASLCYMYRKRKREE